MYSAWKNTQKQFFSELLLLSLTQYINFSIFYFEKKMRNFIVHKIIINIINSEKNYYFQKSIFEDTFLDLYTSRSLIKIYFKI